MMCEIIPIQERSTCKCCVCQSDKSVKYRFTDKQFNQFDVCNKCYFIFTNQNVTNEELTFHLNKFNTDITEV